ncbi:MAG: DUF6066 family protein [Fimbriimonadales bacterium]
MRRLILVLALALGSSAWGAEDAFAKIRDRAKQLTGLGPFLDRYIGHCDDPFSKVECLRNAANARHETEGKLQYLILDDRAAEMIHPAAFDPKENQYRLDMTPYFEADGRSLTEGTPKSQDEQGRPRVALLPIWAKLPEGATPMDLERLFRTGNVRVQIIFKPLGIWKMPRRDKIGTIEGVKARFVAIRLSDARTGDEIAMRIRE